MSWVVNTPLTWLQRLCINVLKCGPIPRHVAFIMDGNRRYATKAHVNKAEGHLRGFERLADCLHWCKELAIGEVTVYAFSIENFNRSQEEVDTLMRLAEEKFRRLLEERDQIMAEGLCIRIIGNLALLSVELRKLVAEVMLLTKDNRRVFLNVAFAYTSRDEIAHSVRSIVEGVRNEQIRLEDVDEELVSGCLYTNDSRNPDMLVRTSGEVRFSDFLLWQISNTQICFTQVLWPEFNIWHLLRCVFHYQRNCLDLRKAEEGSKKCVTNQRVQSFLESLQEAKYLQLQCYLSQI